MSEPTNQSNTGKPVPYLLMVCFMFWASFEAFHDHKPLSALAYISFALAFLMDAFQLRQRIPNGKFVYYGLFALATAFALVSIFRRLYSV